MSRKSLFIGARCLECGHRFEATPLTRSCPKCGSPWLDAVYDLEALPADWKEEVARRPADLWRYYELLPLPDDFHPLTLGEGWTPLTHASALSHKLSLPNLWIKDERQSTTGSFKDRQASIAVNVLRAGGIKEIVLASTGNAATAYAAYCARAGIKLWVFLTSSVPPEKMRELALYGAEVIKVSGTYDQAKEIAADFAKRRGIYKDGGAKSIPCKESMKTIALEIVEQLGWRAPDWYIQAVSGGIGPLGVSKGFRELYEAGIIDRMPKLGIVQSEGCAPMVRAWEKGLEEAEPVQPDSLIYILATGRPGLSYTFLKHYVDRHGGAMVAVNDAEAFRAMRQVARSEGISMEPAAGVAFAGLQKLRDRGYIAADETVVVNCSGHSISAEKHALEDRYFVSINAALQPKEGVTQALTQLDEKVTTIVVIDDNPQDTRLIRRLLQSYKDYRILEAYDGREGIELVEQHHPDLVILDLTMPEVDGFTVLETLKEREQTRDIPIIVISAKSLTNGEEVYLRRYTDSLWQKGNFSARELAQHVVHLLGDEVDLPPIPRRETGPLYTGGKVRSFGKTNKPRVLVVEDNVWEARLLHRILESRRHLTVHEAYTAREALDYALRRPPSLIIVDYDLPGGTGEGLIRQLRENKRLRNIPIIVLAELETEPGLAERLQDKVNSIWNKISLDRNQFLDYVENLLLS